METWPKAGSLRQSSRPFFFSATPAAGPFRLLVCLVLVLSGLLAPWPCEGARGLSTVVEDRTLVQDVTAPTAMTVDECVRQALSVNLSIVKRQYLAQAAKADARVAFKQMLPVVSTGYSYTGMRDAQSVTILDRRISISGHDRYLWDVTLRQPIFQGGVLWNRYRMADLQVDLELMALHQARADIVLQVREQFYTIMMNERLVEEAEASLRRLEALEADTEGFYRAGLVARTDLLQTRVELDRARLSVLKARHELEMAKDGLNLILRRRPGTPLALKGELVEPASPPDLPRLYEAALQARPEVAQAQKALEQARRGEAVAKAAWLPRVDLVAQYAKEGVTPDVSDNPYGDHDKAQVMVEAKWELFSFGRRADAVEANKWRRKVAEATLQEVRDRVLFEVKAAYLLLTDALASITVSKSALKQAEEDYRLTLARFRQQLATNTDTIDAQARLAAARSAYFSSLAAARIAWARLDHAVGKEPARWLNQDTGPSR